MFSHLFLAISILCTSLFGVVSTHPSPPLASLGLSSVSSLMERSTLSSELLVLQRQTNRYTVPRRRSITKVPGYHDAPLTPVEAAQGFTVPVKIGSETRNLILDTGSSDTWVVKTGFQCINVTTQKKASEQSCMFGELFSLGSSDTEVTDYNFNVTYASGETLIGDYYKVNVSVAGITVPHQQVAVVDYAAWYGDGFSSGVLGMAYPALTESFNISNPAKDNSSYLSTYSSIFNTMTTSGSVLPFFSLAIKRDQDQGGYLAFNGLPPVDFTGPFVSMPIETIDLAGGLLNSSLSFYAIRVDGLAPNETASIVRKTANDTNFQVIIDSGTTLIYVPQTISDAINAQFEPPAIYSQENEVYSVPCNASVPTIGVKIAGHTFKINPKDMLYETEIAGECYTGVAPSDGGLSVLGDVFLRNVLVVFDAGASEIRFAAREDY